MYDEFKYDTDIDTFTAYKLYIASKPWVATNYLRDPSQTRMDLKPIFASFLATEIIPVDCDKILQYST